MSTLGPEQWRVLSPYLDKALEIAPEQRSAWLELLREENPSLAENLQTLLKEHEELGNEGFLKTCAAARPAVALLIGQTVGAYTLESPIGQGGMGTVWLARRSDGRFEGRAAVKFLNVGLLGGTGEERFKREGSILARLAHPNIAHLIDAGVSPNGQPYLILEYVQGQPIDVYCDQHALDVEARIRLFLEVLAAVAHAHANLIVHRDIKPSNVLVTGDGQVKLLDFGIAKLLEDEAGASSVTVLTRQGERALTLAYAAPEQVTGHPVTTGTDVYALGVLLYLLLTGKHPAESALQSPADLIKAIVDTDPARPSDITESGDKRKRALRGDLDTIVAKALKKNQQERYTSVTALADDLRRYLGHQTISARTDSLAYRVKKFVRRNYLAVALASIAIVATGTGVVGTLLQARTARLERDFALRQLSRAEAINGLNSFVLSDAAPSGKPFTVHDLLERARRMVERHQGTDDLNRIELLVSIGSQYAGQEESAKARPLLAQAYSLAGALPDPSLRARSACALAEVLSASVPDLPEAERLIQNGLNEIQDSPRFVLDRVFCLLRGSLVALRRGQLHDGVTRAQGAWDALSQSPFKPEVLELDGLTILASAYRQAGQVREASAALEQAAARLTSLGRDDTQTAATLFSVWGATLWQWGRPLDAERVLRRAIAIGQDNQTTVTVFPGRLLNYARVLNDLGRLEEASDYAERADTKARTSGDQVVLNQSQLLRAAIYIKQGDLEHAAQMLLDAEPGLRRNLPAGHLTFATLASQRSLIAQAKGEMQTALDLVSQAVAIAEAWLKTGQGEGYRTLQNALLWRSDIQLQLGHRDEAMNDARRALKMLLDRTQSGTFSIDLGHAYLALGRALAAQGKREEASAPLRSAVEHLQSALGSDSSETRAARQLALESDT